MTSPPLIAMTGIGRTYTLGADPSTVLTQIDLVINDGDFVAIMGASGSGKSTLMNIIGCLDQASCGSYRIRGVAIDGLDRDALAALRRDTFGFIFQRYLLMPDLDAVENSEIPAVYRGTTLAVRRLRAEQLLKELGLGERLHHRPGQLSGGQQQRVSIARALMNGGSVILADEPTGALDAQGGKEVMGILERLHRQGHTLILVTHDQDIAAYAQRILRIVDGRIISDELTPKHDPVTASAPILSQQIGNPGRAVRIEAVTMAVRSLLHNRMRTLLTMLGIVIGVGSVVALMAIGNGAKQDVLERIQAMGTDLLTIERGPPATRASSEVVTSFTAADLPFLAAVPGVAMVVPETEMTSLLRFSSQDLLVTAIGTAGDFPQIHDWPLQAGRFFGAEHVQRYAQVVALGQTVVKTLFPADAEPLGRYVLLGKAPFLVIGVLSAKGSTPRGDDLDNSVWLPYTTAGTRIFGQQFFRHFVVRVTPGANLDEVQQGLHAQLLRRHRVEDFHIRNMADTIATANQTQDTLTYLLAAVAVISLVVGGIGVMNIMLVSVVERTREIGIRMAVGARGVDILFQFLTEAVLVCLSGGILGVLLGCGGGLVVTQLAGWRVVFTPAPMLFAFVSALATGVIFGYLPARKAARLAPVDALARE